MHRHVCCVPMCCNYGRHRFPKKEAVRKQWIATIRKKKHVQHWKPNEGSRICRMHFKNSDFQTTSKDGSPLLHFRLKPGTVPSVFEWTQPENKSSSLSSKKVARSDSQSESTSFLNNESATEISQTEKAKTFFSKERSKIILPTKEIEKEEPVFTTAKSKNRRDENQDVSNWEYRVIRKESLHLEEILGKIEYVFSLQDFNGRELEESELEEIISTFPPLKPPNQILPLRSPNRRSV